jgi:hypothetical protein
MLWATIQLGGMGLMLLTRLAYRPLLQRGSRLLVGQWICGGRSDRDGACPCWPPWAGSVLPLALSPLAGRLDA